jgi:hypothetical protein
MVTADALTEFGHAWQWCRPTSMADSKAWMDMRFQRRKVRKGDKKSPLVPGSRRAAQGIAGGGKSSHPGLATR